MIGSHMNRLISLLFACTIFLSGTAFSTPSEMSINDDVSPKVIRAEFGLFNSPNSGKPTFVPTKVVPLIPKQAYGWIMSLRSDKLKIKWREEFTLPAKPATWGPAESLGSRSVSKDGRMSITEREVSPDRGLIYNSWTVVPGDPPGKYVIRVFVEGSLAKVFEFEVK